MADFRAHGFTCKLLACALRTETGVAAYVEPALVAEGEPEAAVPGNYNLISCTGELLGRQSYFGQGAGRYPTAANVVQDCLDLLAGEDGLHGDGPAHGSGGRCRGTSLLCSHPDSRPVAGERHGGPVG